jgi:tRNA uracil 4-sulfurtransferase
MRRLMVKTAGEIGVKSPRTRRRFVRILRENAHRALARHGVRGKVGQGWGRMLVRTDDPGRGREVLGRVFGFHSISDVTVLRFEGLDELVAQAADLYRNRVAGRTFAVRARRSGEHDFRSGDVNRALGTALLEASSGVDLDHPQEEVAIEIVDRHAYALLGSVPGAGGLPIGTGGRGVALFSGGFDSPVAAWMALSRGIALDLVICDLGGCAQTDGALHVAKELAVRWAPGVEPRAHVVDLLPIVAALTQHVDPRLRQVLLKRAMYRAGALVARNIRAEALVTGEALGQASTQTLRNLAVAEAAGEMPVVRPLVGMSKEEIIGRARDIGTHAASERVKEYCSISTGPVETAARLEEVLTAEGDVDASLIGLAVEKRRVVDLADWERGPLPAYVVEEPVEDAVVVDVRELDEGPDAGDLRLPFSRAEEWLPGLDRDASYLFVCSVGSRSEVLAQRLHERGYRAYCLAGGVRRMGPRAA